MKIAVVGCGAMGSIYAALFADSGHDVFVVDTNVSHVKAINQNGLKITGASGDRTIRLEAFTEAPLKKADIVIVAVKAMYLTSAVPAIRTLIDSGSIIVTIQNGLGGAESLAGVIKHRNFLIGVAQGFGASILEPGLIHHSDMKSIRIGRLQSIAGDDSQEQLLNDVTKIWQHAGFEAYAEQDIRAVQWEKLICNVAYSSLCALTGMTLGEVLGDEYIGNISRAAAIEAWEVARAHNILLSFDDPVKEIRDFGERMPNAKPSVLLDIEAGRPSEILFISGAVPIEAKKVGKTAPVNNTLTGLVRSLERCR
ncbi:MAG TPA: 2-dehydropantoate 2-reductase [Porticoccaceae bacterium]|nr:2-dehydropantoate 2-reductase [Gammaproteobacteria bacterium]HIL61473.1 2-dehydropantoate 2-reductase [Porticoccaceae bacterium]